LVAQHALSEGRRQRVIILDHLKGIVGASKTDILSDERCESELLRPFEEYEQIVGGGW